MIKSALQDPGVATKSEIDDLFERLFRLYGGGLFAGVPFPIHQAEQARAWRGFPRPDWEALKQAVHPIDEIKIGRISGGFEEPSLFPYTDGSIGMKVGWLGALIVIAETVFRVVQRGELELEAIFPAVLSSRGLPIHSEPRKELLRGDFRRLAAEKLRGSGREWVLAGGRTPLSIRGRPPFIAPKVVGAVVCRRLTVAKVPRGQAENLAARLSSVLLGRPVRVEDVAHWDREFFRVKIESGTQEVSLTAYLAEPLTLVSREAIDRATPHRILDVFKLPQNAFAQFAGRISPIERASARVRREPPRQVSRQEVNDQMFSCSRCGELVEGTASWGHLSGKHGVREEDLHLSDDGKEIQLKSTREVLAATVKRDGFGQVHKRRREWAGDRSIYEGVSGED